MGLAFASGPGLPYAHPMPTATAGRREGRPVTVCGIGSSCGDCGVWNGDHTVLWQTQ